MSLFIDEHRSVFGVEPICRALAVNTNRLRRTRGGSLSAEARGFFLGFLIIRAATMSSSPFTPNDCWYVSHASGS
jgi:hypothetical protein